MKKKYQHSKLMFNILLLNGILWVWACFVLAYFDKPQIAERLAIASVTTILGSFITLCTKSYKETKQEKIQNLNEQMYYDSREQSNSTDELFNDFEDAAVIEEFDDINSDLEDV